MEERRANLARRLRALGQCVELAEGRVDITTLEHVKDVIRRAGDRAAISGEKTVVALAGPTGVGKSTLFNALSGTDFAEVGVRRPTTSNARAVAWGSALPAELLDWLEISDRHLVTEVPEGFAELVLVDLPDYDSVESEHRTVVDHLVKVVDALIWVVDPEKYADAALHDGYLRPLRDCADVMMVAFNKADALDAADLNRCVRDMRHLLDDAGLKATRIVTTAAEFGTGIDPLREVISRTVSAKVAMATRLAQEVSVAAYNLEIELGKSVPVLNRRAVTNLIDGLAESAGVPELADGIGADYLARGRAVTGWPFTARRYRKSDDPLRRYRKANAELPAGKVSFDSAVRGAKLESSLREFSDSVAGDLPAVWKQAVWEAAHSNSGAVKDQLRDIAAASLPPEKPPAWWQLFRIFQWLAVLAVIGGVLWLVSGPVLQWCGYEPLPSVYWLGIAAPLWLLVGGIVLGVAAGLIGRAVIIPAARLRTRGARRELNDRVEAVAQAQVVAAVQQELTRYSDAVRLVRAAIL
ncbi:MAG: 50S ribosome-binding GTPase [Propionibacteriaceae bacterium]|jgi:GTP-binding protein EngB required for normal cell division|nr:50S ribosome-binding GTPase [Propionibacteriaceae bacterium]